MKQNIVQITIGLNLIVDHQKSVIYLKNAVDLVLIQMIAIGIENVIVRENEMTEIENVLQELVIGVNMSVLQVKQNNKKKIICVLISKLIKFSEKVLLQL